MTTIHDEPNPDHTADYAADYPSQPEPIYGILVELITTYGITYYIDDFNNLYNNEYEHIGVFNRETNLIRPP